MIFSTANCKPFSADAEGHFKGIATSRETGPASVGDSLGAVADHPPQISVRNAKAATVAERLRGFLRSLNTTVYQISQATANHRFGKGTRSHIRDAFYAEVQSGQTPDIYQLSALATLTGYRLVDWLQLFGYEIDKIIALQLALHLDRTILLPGNASDPLLPLPYIRGVQAVAQLDRTQPFISLIDTLDYAELHALEELNRRHFVYAHVGRHDQMMWPLIAASSIVRADPNVTTVESDGRRRICLVQRSSGLSCCYAERRGEDLVLLAEDGSPHFLCCRADKEVKIIGTIDLELRLCQVRNTVFLPANNRDNGERTHLAAVPTSNTDAGAYARLAHERIGLHFREAHSITQQVATYFGDKNYAVALGWLSDTETRADLPRQIPKLLSMCVAYAMDFWAYLRAGGVLIEPLSGRPIPREFLSQEPHQSAVELVSAPSRVDGPLAMQSLIDQLDEIPFFLLPHIKSAVGHEQLSLDDIYVLGKQEAVLHPILQGAVLVIVNRRQHRLPDARAGRVSFDQPMFLIRVPSGRLIVGMCATSRDTVLICPHGKFRLPTMIFQKEEIYVIGRVVAVLRNIVPCSRSGL